MSADWLQTKVAIYVVSFNYALEKVIGFTRIPLQSVTSIQKGPYILSPLQEAGRDPVEVCISPRRLTVDQTDLVPELGLYDQLLTRRRADTI